MSFERYLTGNRVYRHGSSAPTVGTVNPSGYVERELRKRMLGPDGMSDTRSGLASAALQRLRGMGGGQRQIMPWMPGGGGSGAPQRTTLPVGGSAPITFQPGGGSSQALGQDQAALHAKIAAVKAQHMAEIAQQQAAMRAKIAGRPQVGPTGKVKPSVPAKPKPKPATALPWDLEAMQAKSNAGNVLGQLRNAINAQRQSAEREYSSGMHGLDTQQPGEESGLLNNFAGRGLAFSSGYGQGVGDLQNKFAGLRSALAGQRGDTLADLLNREQQGSVDYNTKLANIQQALAQRLAKRAGTLGWGPTSLTAPKPKVGAKKGKKK